jgi:cell division transport system permease protein
VKQLGISDIAGATEQLEGNPLVDELKVKARTSKDVPILAKKLTQMPGIEEVQYLDEALKRMQQLSQGLGWVSFAITTVLTLTAVAVITTTIRLIVMARRREIEIMQLVGATASWIYLPFILQGITFGVAGALIAWALITSVQQFLANLLATGPDFIQFIVGGAQPKSPTAITAAITTFEFGYFDWVDRQLVCSPPLCFALNGQVFGFLVESWYFVLSQELLALALITNDE